MLAASTFRVFRRNFRDLVMEFRDVFDEPGAPVERDIKHRIDLLDETAPPPQHR